jgi:glycosyltransferase involved in cell wall biosynthesis
LLYNVHNLLMKTFSVIIPTYNRGYILWKTIQSVQKQIYPHWELIVVDDGSTDNTRRVVAEFQKDPRIRYIKMKNGGPSKARNAGLQQASGDIITYLDSDDYFYEHCLSVAYEHFKKYSGTVFAVPNYNRRVELYNDDYTLVDFTESFSAQKIDLTVQDVFHWNVKSAFGTGLFHTRQVIKDGIRWDEKIQVFDDWDFFLQLAEKYPDGFLYINYALYEYLQKYGMDGLCSNTTYGDWAKGFEYIYTKHQSAPLMKGQTWYPQRVKKYSQMQKDFESGKVHSAVYKYFPEYFKREK